MTGQVMVVDGGSRPSESGCERSTGKIAIVTGAGSGIGKATVDLFRSEGATVIGADLQRRRRRPATPATKRRSRRWSSAVVAEHGGLDIFFANAGDLRRPRLDLRTDRRDDWAEILRVNLIGPSLAIKHAAPRSKERGGGSIICTASVAGLRSGAGGPAYSASKAGVISLVKVAATAARPAPTSASTPSAPA